MEGGKIMLDNNKKMLIITAILIFIIMTITIVYANINGNKSSSQKPQSKTPMQQKDNSPAEKWYVQFTAKQQQTTAYTEEINAPRPANGQHYFNGGIAVHPRYPGYDPRVPIIPFGTVVYPSPPLEINGNKYHSLVVMDTGDINYGLWGNYPYWFDVYFGNTEYYNIQNAKKYGAKKHDYYWYEEWK